MKSRKQRLFDVKLIRQAVQAMFDNVGLDTSVSSDQPINPDPARAAAVAEALEAQHGQLAPPDVVELAVKRLFPGRITVVSSFGTEAAVLLALAAEVDPGLPITFVDTRKLFGETLRYRDTLAAFLGLTNVQTVIPDPAAIKHRDPDDMLWHSDSDACCHVRKTLPLAEALKDFDAWITGRKRFQSHTRANIPVFEEQDGWVKVNPLASWNKDDLEEQFERRGLPRHPLEADGFLSIGCYTCTQRVAQGADPRSGRWAGKEKTECGIHFASLDGSSL